MTPRQRIAAAALSLSAVGFGALVAKEGYTDKAIIPVPGDRPTVGFGATFKEDGSPVKMTDTITPPAAVRLALHHIAKNETQLQKCLASPLHQKEYDLLVDFAYQYGVGAACSSTLVKHTNAQRYAQACEEYARWTYVAGRDCSIRTNQCYGVYLRAQARRAECLSAQ